MKIKYAQAVALMVAVGFPKAGDWELAKLQARVNQVPSKVDRTTVPEEFLELYDNVETVQKAGNDGAVIVELTPTAGGATEAPAETKKSKKKKPSALKGTHVDVGEDLGEKPRKPARSQAKKSGESKVVKAAKAMTSPDKKVDRDVFGCAKGTISHKVNAVLSEEWQTEAEIAKAANVSLDQARGRLYYGAEEKIMEYRKLIQYRLVPAAGTTPAGKSKKKK